MDNELMSEYLEAVKQSLRYLSAEDKADMNVPNLFALPIAIPGAIQFYYLSKKMWKVFKSFLGKSSESYKLNRYGCK